MTIRFKGPFRVVSDYDVKVLMAAGHTVRVMGVDQFVLHVELAPNGAVKRILEFEWPGGPKSATLIGSDFRGCHLFVDCGPARAKGARVAERIGDFADVDERAAKLRVRRTGRPMAWWASRVALMKREPNAETRKES